MRFAAQHGISGGGAVKADHTETALDEVLGWTLAALGFYFQYSLGFQVMVGSVVQRWQSGCVVQLLSVPFLGF